MAAPVHITYLIRLLGDDRPRLLMTDPTTAPPLPVARLVVNAVATFLLVVSAGLGVAATAPRLLGYGSTVVTSGSMSPTIRVADVVVTAPTDGVGLGEGVVIDYSFEDGRRLHRITAVSEDGYRTAGDANRTEDTDLVTASQVRGIGVVVVPFVGHPVTWLQRGQWLPLGMTVLVLVGAMYVARARWTDVEKDVVVA